MLDNLDKNKNPFKVPENYFEGLTKDIMSNLPAKEHKQVKKVKLWKKVLPWAGIAALIAVIAVSVKTMDDMPQMVTENNGTDVPQAHVKLAYNEVEDYFLFLEDETTEALYIDVLLEEEL